MAANCGRVGPLWLRLVASSCRSDRVLRSESELVLFDSIRRLTTLPDVSVGGTR